MSNRWTQDDEHHAWLPEGVRCIGYDTDTTQYIFIDREGTKYKGEPGSKNGGNLKPMLDHNQSFEQERPQAFRSPTSSTEYADDDRPQFAPTTFEQFVPSHLITSPTAGSDDPFKSKVRLSKPSLSKQDPNLAKDDPTSAPPVAQRVKDSVRKTGKMQGVVKGLKGLVGASKKSGGGGQGKS